MIGLVDPRYCTFRLADLHLGISVVDVQEVMRSQERTRVPLASPVIHGLINLRGGIVTTIDLRRRLGLGPCPDDCEPIDVVVRHGDGVVSLLVDEIGDVFDSTDHTVESLPPTVRSEHRDVVSGVYALDEHLLLVLDTERLLDLASFAAPTTASSPVAT
ncbi:chemotaxis protein CheW [Ilumatobacter sp.]|uniref:chemotaxis protein CheW n=1 Tax=Ilumatobacter sp. TaxID=1967498 RepID=UPI003B52910E